MVCHPLLLILIALEGIHWSASRQVEVQCPCQTAGIQNKVGFSFAFFSGFKLDRASIVDTHNLKGSGSFESIYSCPGGGTARAVAWNHLHCWQFFTIHFTSCLRHGTQCCSCTFTIVNCIRLCSQFIQTPELHHIILEAVV